MKRASFVGICMALVGCSSAGETKVEDAGAPASSAAPARARLTSKDSLRVEQPQLGADQVRVQLFVLPGDAIVEVDGVQVRRRQGTIELVGKVGEEHRVRVRVSSEMMQADEKVVKIEANATEPALIDARNTVGAK